MIRPRPDAIRPYVKPRLHGARRPRGQSGGAARRRAEDLASAEIDRQERVREFGKPSRISSLESVDSPGTGGPWRPTNTSSRDPFYSTTGGLTSSQIGYVAGQIIYLPGPFHLTGWC